MEGKNRKPRTRGGKVGAGRSRVRGRGRGGVRVVVPRLQVKQAAALEWVQPLETPLHPIRQRTWHRPVEPQSELAVGASEAEPALLMETSPFSSPLLLSPIKQKKGVGAAAAMLMEDMAENVPSPENFVAVVGSSDSTPVASPSSVQHPRPQPRQILNDDGTEAALNNIGSEPGSEESEDEDGIMLPAIPRALAGLLDTPLDDDAEIEPTDEEPIAAADDLETEGPRKFLDFKWEEFPTVSISPRLRREQFQSNAGPTTPCVDPYEIFISIWDKQIMEHIASETNKYAQFVAAQLLATNNLRPNSRISRWQDTDVDELYVFFGILMAMGVVVKSNVKDYWCSTADIFYTPGFSANMPLNRFILLSKCLHFNDNNDMSAVDPSEAKLNKIKPILDHLNGKFQSMYKLQQNISLDESLLMWKGWLNISQLIPNKAAVVGIKSYEVCESQTGYLWRFEMHAHKRLPSEHPEDTLNTYVPTLVLRLLHGLENLGHTVWMDNFYNSPALARRLKSIGIDCAGTLRTNRKFVPQQLHDLSKSLMRRGEVSGLTSGDVDVLVWMDNNRVAMISTYHGNGSHQDVRGSIKPTMIFDYNIMMGGVDKKDQMLAMYPIERKRTKVWYKKLFRRLLNVSILNSFVIHKSSSPSSSALTHRQFRISLVNALLSRHLITPRPSFPSLEPLKKVRPDITHRLAEYPVKSGAQRQRRRCVVCKKRIHTFCNGCSKTVCIDQCFVSLHNVK